MMTHLIRFLSAAGLCLAVTVAGAAEIKLLSPIAFEPAAVVLIPEFEKLSGHKVTVSYGTAGAIAGRVEKGEAVDVVMTAVPLLEKLQGQGKLLAGSRADICKVGLGVFVRQGAPRPDISSVEAFKRSLSEAKSIGYVNPSFGVPTGIYMTGLLERLGMAEEMRPKTRLLVVADRFAGITRGEADIGFNQMSEIVAEHGIDLVGPLPAPIQNYTSFAAAVTADSSAADAARALIAHFSSPASRAIIKIKGFE